MSKTQTVYARLELKTYNEEFRLVEHRSEINERLYEVLSDDYYMRRLTQQLVRVHSDILGPWETYRKNPTTLNRPENDIRAVGKFLVQDQRIDLVDIRFY